MSKPLTEMTLEELWILFPIILTEHNPEWKNWFREEKQYLTSLFSNQDIEISHIGSTAISNIWAKPIVDILIEVPAYINIEEIKDQLINNGYLCMSEQENRKSLNKGYTPEGFAEKVFHLHLRRSGDNNELYFRDYLNANPEVAKEYEKLKLSLCKKYRNNRDAYTEAKSDFILKYTKIAKSKF